MAAYVQSAAVEAVVAGEHCVRGYYAFVEECQALCCLERGTRRVDSHDGAVKEWQPRVVGELVVHLASVASGNCARVVGRR